jgi:hypothetical protein
VVGACRWGSLARISKQGNRHLRWLLVTGAMAVIRYLVETETRYWLFSQPRKLRLLGWINSAFAGSYAGALDLIALDPSLDPTDALDQTRQGRIKYGFIVNLEKAISDQFGIFSRLSWNDGKNEIMSFTDIDASASFGGVWKGSSWGRPLDRIGVAGCPTSGEALCHSMDGGDPRRHRRRDWGSLRSQVHAALVLLGRGGRRKVHGPGSA